MTEHQGKALTVLQPRALVGDPHVMSDDRSRLSIIFSIYESLVRRDAAGEYVPCLAESWSLDDEARTWTFELRKNVLYHNGDSLEADDVKATLDRVRDPNMGGELGTSGVYASYLDGAVFKAVDRYTFEIELAEPMADLLDLIVDLPIVPQSALDGLPDIAVGSGPYRLVGAGDDAVLLVAFDNYWGGCPGHSELHWQAEPDVETRLTKLFAGEADIVSDLDPESVKTIENSAGVELVAAQSTVCCIFLLNIASGVCGDKRVRQALNYALDMEHIIQTAMSGAAQPLNGPLTPSHFGYDPVDAYPHDPAKAKKLLADAGYTDGLKLVLDVPTTWPDEATEVAKLMAQQYATVGIDTEVREFSDRPAYAEMVRDKEMDDGACFDSSPLSTYRILKEKLHSGVAGPWWQGYTNHELDELLDRARVTPDVDLRRSIYREAYRIIHDDAPWIFLHNSTLFWGVGPTARDFSPTVEGRVSVG